MERIKYPRTYHFYNSPNLQNDDRKLETYDGFYKTKAIKCEQHGFEFCAVCERKFETVPREVIATLKLDGENTTMYGEHIHARSLDSAHHESRTIVKQIHGQIKHLLPDRMRVCGENMQACHSIYYTGLPAYFLIFNIWQDDLCLSYEETMMWVHEFRHNGIQCAHVPVFYRGPFDIDHITRMYQQFYVSHEGFVVRDIDSFSLVDFSTHCGKYVRKGHVQTSEHWLNERMLPNKLREFADESILCYTRNGQPLNNVRNES
jgi:hypothetical protein